MIKKILLVVGTVAVSSCMTSGSPQNDDGTLSKAQMDAAISAATPECKQLFEQYESDVSKVSAFDDEERWGEINNAAQKTAEKEGCNQKVLVTIGVDNM